MRSRNAGLRKAGREPQGGRPGTREGAGTGSTRRVSLQRLPEVFLPRLRGAFSGAPPPPSITGKKKKSREVSAKQRWSREDGAALSGARMTPVPSVINDTKKSSSRWSNGLGSFKYKQITPQNERFCFNRTGRAQLRAPGRRTRAAGAAREHSESTTKRRAALGPPAARSPQPAPNPQRTAGRSAGSAAPNKGAGRGGPAPSVPAPPHLPCRSSPASSPRLLAGPPHGRGGAERGQRRGRAARLGHRPPPAGRPYANEP